MRLRSCSVSRCMLAHSTWSPQYLRYSHTRFLLSQHRRMGLSSTPITQPRKFPTSGFDTINSTILFEEESLPGYLKAHYYPVCLGEVLNTRYQILTKLGFGSTSTVWLCRDLHQNRYLTLKVHVRSTQPPPDVQISQHLKSLQSTHTGQRYTRIALDSFQIRGPHGPHHCTLYQPAGIDIRDYIHCLEGDALPENLLRVTVRFMLVALDYLHEAKVVHTDINPHNILLGIDDTSILTEMEEDELSNPAPQKLLSDRTIFATRAMPLSTGEPVLADLGEARIAQTTQTGLIMPSVYRAPEVMLGMQWDEKVDVWGLGQTAWTLFEQGHLFTTPDLESEMDHARRFAEMMALLGPPPVEFLRRSERSWRFWDENGKWNGRVDIPEQSLETRETRLQGDGKVLFLRFLRKALSWVPEDRPTAKELLMDEWVRGDDY